MDAPFFVFSLHGKLLK